VQQDSDRLTCDMELKVRQNCCGRAAANEGQLLPSGVTDLSMFRSMAEGIRRIYLAVGCFQYGGDICVARNGGCQLGLGRKQSVNAWGFSCKEPAGRLSSLIRLKIHLLRPQSVDTW